MPTDKGFSLVELSIVLVILGLLVGGILGGQSLIKAAEMRNIPTEMSKWQTAGNAFRTKYNALPGDFKDATKFWNPAASCPPAPGDPDLLTTTCDGNGDGNIGNPPAQYYEMVLFWQHLSQAGLVDGSYTGIPGDGHVREHTPGINSPASKFPNGGWSITYFSGGSVNQYAMDYGNAFIFGAERATYPTTGKLLTPEQAWNIDTKMDDGLPAKGNVIAHWLVNECSAADNGTHTNTNHEAHYRLEDETPQCSLFFRNAL